MPRNWGGWEKRKDRQSLLGPVAYFCPLKTHFLKQKTVCFSETKLFAPPQNKEMCQSAKAILNHVDYKFKYMKSSDGDRWNQFSK